MTCGPGGSADGVVCDERHSLVGAAVGGSAFGGVEEGIRGGDWGRCAAPGGGIPASVRPQDVGRVGPSSGGGGPGGMGPPVCSAGRLRSPVQAAAGSVSGVRSEAANAPSGAPVCSASSAVLRGAAASTVHPVARHDNHLCGGGGLCDGRQQAVEAVGGDNAGPAETVFSPPSPSGPGVPGSGQPGRGEAPFGTSQAAGNVVDRQRTPAKLFGAYAPGRLFGSSTLRRHTIDPDHSARTAEGGPDLHGTSSGAAVVGLFDPGSRLEEAAGGHSEGAGGGAPQFVSGPGEVEGGQRMGRARNPARDGPMAVPKGRAGGKDRGSSGTCRGGQERRRDAGVHGRDELGGEKGSGGGAASHVVAAVADAGPVILPDTELKVRAALKKLLDSGLSYEVPAPGYERVIAGVLSRAPQLPVPVRSGEFGEYAVECVKVEVVRQWMCGHEDTLAWQFLRDPKVVSQWGAVGGLSFTDGKSSRLSDDDWEQLVEKGVVSPCRKSDIRFVAFAFKVLKSDGVKARLIWSGLSFNALFQRPPPFELLSIPRLVASLLGPSGCKLISADLRSWFVQLPPCAWLSRFFGIRLGDKYGRLKGIPMGWSFAPFVAQQFARALARRLSSLLAKRGIAVEFVVWIDNLLGAVPVSVPGEIIHEVFEQVAKESGCVWKEVLVGEELEALGISWDLRKRRWRLKPDWVSKVSALWAQQGSTLYKWWCLCACAMRALAVWQTPLCTVAPILEWLGVQSRKLVAGELNWESEVCLWTKAQRVLDEVFGRIRENAWRGWSPPPARRIYGVADASMEGRAWALHSHEGMVVQVSKNEIEAMSITELELKVALEGLSEVPEDASVQWMSDNGAVVWILDKWYCKMQKWNGRLWQVWENLCRKGSRVEPGWKMSEAMEMDVFSRPLEKLQVVLLSPIRFVGPPCPLHPGACCPEFRSFLSQAESFLRRQSVCRGGLVHFSGGGSN